MPQFNKVFPEIRESLSPAAWGSPGHLAPRPHPPRAQKRCGSVQAECLGQLAPGNSSVADTPPTLPYPPECSPPSWPESWCTSQVCSWPTSWRWLSHFEQWPSGTGLYKWRPWMNTCATCALSLYRFFFLPCITLLFSSLRRPRRPSSFSAFK